MFVQRHHLFRDISHIYTNNPSMLNGKPSFTYLGEDGVDVDGVTRDVFATFWEESKQIFESHACRTSLVPVKCYQNTCELFSNVLVHSLVLTGQVPYYLSCLLVIGIICSSDEITPSLREKCVQLFIELHCKDTQDKLRASCISGVSKENQDEMQDFFLHYGEDLDLTADFKTCLESLIIKRLFVKPPCFVRKCAKKLKEILGPLTAFNAFEVLNSLQPTGQKIVGCLLSHPLCASMDQSPKGVALSFLKLFLTENGQDVALMKHFLKFVTGSFALTEPKIYVQFGGKFPYPTSSTCSCTITLPIGVYKSFKEFEIMFTNLLRSECSQMFTDT